MLAHEYDELADDDPRLLQAEPMIPIRFEYLTTTRDLRIQTDMLERLGLVHTFVGQNLYAVNECDSNSLRLTATDLIMHDGIREPTESMVTSRAEQLLRQVVAEHAASFARSAVQARPNVVEKLAQEMRAQADADLARNGVDLKARLAAAISEWDAA